MSDFVEECRREWRRLRVPSGPADEMADDLAADLAEAEAEGAFPEEVLGESASDPRAFAEAWARERGLVRPRWSDTLRTRRTVVAAAAVLSVLAVGAALGSVLSSSRGTTPGNAAVPATTVVRAAVGTSSFVSNLAAVLVGTSIGTVRLLPANVHLSSHVPLAQVLSRAPTSLMATVRNSGSRNIARVTLVIEVDRHRITRTVRDIPPAYQRQVAVPLPAHLPDTFTVRVRTVPLPGELNTANNSATWKVRVRG